ncbi:hypothetical protein, partial [uncultured Duncaniella sp.]
GRGGSSPFMRTKHPMQLNELHRVYYFHKAHTKHFWRLLKEFDTESMPVHRAAKLIIFFFSPIEISTVSFMTLRSASASTVSFFKPSAPSAILKDMDIMLFEAILFGGIK